MRIVRNAAELGDIVDRARCAGQGIGLVPTMGALHAGHLRLAEVAREEIDLVVMSIFVNPTQFGPNEDFERYPRDLERDAALAAAGGVDVIFAPGEDVMYPGGTGEQMVWVEPGPLADFMEGAHRPGHFRGVLTVVAKLLHLAWPDRAYFGQKDGQQAAMVQRMVRDLLMPIEIRVVPTVRECDGLALSSRNVYLSAPEREHAPTIYQALLTARAAVEAGERDAVAIERVARQRLHGSPLIEPEYVELADLATMQPVEGALDGNAMLAIAARLGRTRLIDNLVIRLDGNGVAFE